jgi:hypothetical protein
MGSFLDWLDDHFLLCIGLLVVLFFSIGLLYQIDKECEDKQGTLVRTLSGLKCIKAIEAQ